MHNLFQYCVTTLACKVAISQLGDLVACPTENFENLDSLRLNFRAFLMILKIGLLSTPVQSCLASSICIIALIICSS